MAEKRCHELEEFIQTNWNSGSVKIEKSTEVSASSREPNRKKEALADNGDALNFNDNGIYNSNANSKDFN